MKWGETPTTDCIKKICASEAVDSADTLQKKFDIRTQYEDGKVIFIGVMRWMDQGKSTWSEISALMRDTETNYHDGNRG